MIIVAQPGDGLYPQAEPLYREALAIWQKVLPNGHPIIATSLNNLAGLYDSQGRYAEAEPVYHEASSIIVRAFGVEHPTTQTVLNNYFGFMSQQGRQQQAVDFLQGFGISVKGEPSD